MSFSAHIATVGKAMSSPEEVAYPILRKHDVSYVLIIFGGLIGYSGDDLNKFLWMIRIAQGVWPDEIQEPNYFNQGEYRVDDRASPAMRESLMYKMSYYRFGELFGGQQPMDRVRGQQVPLNGPKLDYVGEWECKPRVVQVSDFSHDLRGSVYVRKLDCAHLCGQGRRYPRTRSQNGPCLLGGQEAQAFQAHLKTESYCECVRVYQCVAVAVDKKNNTLWVFRVVKWLLSRNTVVGVYDRVDGFTSHVLVSRSNPLCMTVWLRDRAYFS